MCPLYPFHYIIIYFFIIFSLFYMLVAAVDNLQFWNVTFAASSVIDLKISETKTVDLSISKISDYDLADDYIIKVLNGNSDVTTCSPMYIKIPHSNDNYTLFFNVTGKFVGISNITLELKDEKSQETIKLSSSLKVTVTREIRLIDRIFTASVAILVSIIFINFGCALNWKIVNENFKKPADLLIGTGCQFVIMPIMSYGLGQFIFPDSLSMRLGLFFTGVSPSGGASNIWIYTLKGNINLSIAITAVGNLCAFFMMPLWTFTLGRAIFHSGSMIVPYTKIATFAISLIFPLALGFMLQKTCPKFSQLMVKILKPFSSFLIIFIIVFATYTNLYLLKLFTADILLVGFCLPFFGYVLAWFIAYSMNRSFENCLAISVETGVQNTGIAIFMLRFSLPQPEADLTTVIPVAVALMTPVPLLLWYFLSKLFYFRKSAKQQKQNLQLEFPVDRVSNSGLVNEFSPSKNKLLINK